MRRHCHRGHRRGSVRLSAGTPAVRSTRWGTSQVSRATGFDIHKPTSLGRSNRTAGAHRVAAGSIPSRLATYKVLINTRTTMTSVTTIRCECVSDRSCSASVRSTVRRTSYRSRDAVRGFERRVWNDSARPVDGEGAIVKRTVPLRLLTRTSGPPPLIVPAALRFDVGPCTSAPIAWLN